MTMWQLMLGRVGKLAAIRDFFGSLDRHKAAKGVFVTTYGTRLGDLISDMMLAAGSRRRCTSRKWTKISSWKDENPPSPASVHKCITGILLAQGALIVALIQYFK